MFNMPTKISQIRTKICISVAIPGRFLITELDVYKDNANNDKSAS